MKRPHRYFPFCNDAAIVGFFGPRRHRSDGRQLVGFVQKARREVIGTETTPTQPRKVDPVRIGLVVFRPVKDMIDNIGHVIGKVVDLSYDLW